MREILFRAKSLESKEWVFGSLFVTKYNKYILPLIDETIKAVEMIAVIDETVGQFTGLKDSEGVKIFEGDVVLLNNSTYQVEFAFGQWCLTSNGVTATSLWLSHDHVKVIGSIHENPELLKS